MSYLWYNIIKSHWFQSSIVASKVLALLAAEAENFPGCWNCGCLGYRNSGCRGQGFAGCWSPDSPGYSLGSPALGSLEDVCIMHVLCCCIVYVINIYLHFVSQAPSLQLFLSHIIHTYIAFLLILLNKPQEFQTKQPCTHTARLWLIKGGQTWQRPAAQLRNAPKIALTFEWDISFLDRTIS